MKISFTIIVLLSIAAAQGLEQNLQYADLMPGITVTAPRYRPDNEVCAGSMPAKTGLAPRYGVELDAWIDVMPEVVVTAVRPESEPIAHWDKQPTDTKSDLDLLSSTVQQP